MSIKNLFSDKKGKIAIIFLAFIIIVAITFGITYYFMYGSTMVKYKNSIKKTISYIDKSNTKAVSIYDYMKDGDLQIDKIKSTIESSKKDLEEASKIVKDNTPPEEYKKLHSNILNGINSNKTLFIQTTSILDNYSSSTVDNSINALYEYLSITSSYYEKVDFKGITIPISNEFLSFPDKISDYINSLTKETDSTIPNYDMQIAYLNNIKNTLEEVETLEDELNKKIDDSKNGGLSYKQLMISISSTKNKLSYIIDETNSSVAPSEVEDMKTNLLSLLKLYENHLTAFRNSIESSKEQETTYIVSSSLKINQNSLNNFKSKKDDFKNLLIEKENSFN